MSRLVLQLLQQLLLLLCVCACAQASVPSGLAATAHCMCCRQGVARGTILQRVITYDRWFLLHWGDRSGVLGGVFVGYLGTATISTVLQ